MAAGRGAERARDGAAGRGPRQRRGGGAAGGRALRSRGLRGRRGAQRRDAGRRLQPRWTRRAERQGAQLQDERRGRRVAAPCGALVEPGPDRPVTSVITPVRWTGERLVLLDQTLLPGRELEREYTRWEDVAEAIRALVVRGAPATGVAAAFGVALAARQSAARPGEAPPGGRE